MKSQNLIILVVAVLILGGAGYAFSQQGNQEYTDDSTMMGTERAIMDDAEQQDTIMKKDNMDAKADSTMEEDATMKDDGMSKDDVENEVMMMKGSYESYSPEKLARADTGKVVLFFHASWCPTCRALDADITTNLESIPDGVSILKLNFDTETALRKKYGVTVQHTLVQVNSSGDQITKWSGGNTLAYTLSQLQ